MRFWGALDDVLLAGPCPGCRRPVPRAGDGVACIDCLGALAWPARRVVPGGAVLPPVFAVARYREPVRGLLIAHKERGALSLAWPLGRAVSRAVWVALGPPPHLSDRPWPTPGREVLVVPMPSARRAVRARGHDAIRRMAARAVDDLRRRGMPARLCPVLGHAREVADQAGLGRASRAANLAGALRARRGWRPPGPVDLVLVDDLLTTGATLAEGWRALRAAGAGWDGCSVVAAVIASAVHADADDER